MILRTLLNAAVFAACLVVGKTSNRKNEKLTPRHNRQHNDGKVTSLGFLLGLPVQLSNGIAVQTKCKTTIKLRYTGDLLVSKLAVWVLCMDSRA